MGRARVERPAEHCMSSILHNDLAQDDSPLLSETDESDPSICPFCVQYECSLDCITYDGSGHGYNWYWYVNPKYWSKLR